MRHWRPLYASGRPAGHVGGQPALEALAQFCDQNGALVLQRQCIPAGRAELPRRDAGRPGPRHHLLGDVGVNRDHVAPLVLAEPEGVGCKRCAIELGADAGRHRHFGERDQEPAVGDIMHRGGDALDDQRADEIAGHALGRKIDRRRRALLALADFAQVERLAEPAIGLADEQDGLVGGLEGERRRLGEIVDQADAADRGRRQDRPAVGLVVERDIAGHDREIERLAGLGDAADRSRPTGP